MVLRVAVRDRPPRYLLTVSARFLLLILLSIVLSACTTSGDSGDSGEGAELVSETVPAIRFPWPNVAIEQVFADPHAYVGKTVVVHGEVTEIIDQNAITNQDGGEAMLVVGGNLPIEQLETGDFVRVDGAIRDFDIREIERELGFELRSEQLARFNDQPVSVASNVTLGPTSVDDLVANAGVFAGQAVTVTGEFANDAGGDGFVLKPIDGDDALVVTTPEFALEDLPTGAWVQVAGVVELNGHVDPPQDRGEHPYQVTLEAESVEVVAPLVTTSVVNILTDDGNLTGEHVTLVAEIDDVLGPGVFTLEPTGPLALLLGELFVIADPKHIPTGLSGDERVAVSGTVVIVEADTKRGLAERGINLDVSDLERIGEGPIILADEVIVVARE